MEVPKINFLNWSSTIGTLVTLVSGLLPFSSWTWQWKVIIALVCLISSICYAFFDFRRQSIKLFNSYAELHNRHQAISKQFDQKNRALDEYEYAFLEFGRCITIGLMQLSQKEKKTLEAIYSMYMIHGQKIKGDKFHA